MKYLVVALAALLFACQPQADQQQTQATPPRPAPGTPEWKVANAMSAAPDAISRAAAVMDFGADGKLAELRAGTNGWTCLPDNPETPGNDPMCVDRNFMAWVTEWLGRKPPQIKSVGFGYMLQGGTDASNTDPFKMKPDSGEAWVDTGPHVMLVVPNVSAVAGLPTDHESGQPYIMWQGTPYAHVMLPVK